MTIKIYDFNWKWCQIEPPMFHEIVWRSYSWRSRKIY